MDCDLKNQLLRYLAEPHEGQTPAQYAFVDLPLGGVRLFPTVEAALEAAMERLVQVGRVRRLPQLPPGHVALDISIIGPPSLIMERMQDMLRANEYFHILPVYPDDQPPGETMSLDVHLSIEVDTGGPEPHRADLFDGNCTHNLRGMADAAGIYMALWRPEEIGIAQASQLIAPLRSGLLLLRDNPAKFQVLNPPNGWGDYDGFVSFVQGYLRACEAHPKAQVSVSR